MAKRRIPKGNKQTKSVSYLPLPAEIQASLLGLEKRLAAQQGRLWLAMNVCNLIAEVTQDENVDIWGSARLAAGELDEVAKDMGEIIFVLGKANTIGDAA